MIQDRQCCADKRQHDAGIGTHHGPSKINVAATLVGHNIPTSDTTDQNAKPNQEGGD